MRTVGLGGTTRSEPACEPLTRIRIGLLRSTMFGASHRLTCLRCLAWILNCVKILASFCPPDLTTRSLPTDRLAWRVAGGIVRTQLAALLIKRGSMASVLSQ